jgi:hypothetical protein
VNSTHEAAAADWLDQHKYTLSVQRLCKGSLDGSMDSRYRLRLIDQADGQNVFETAFSNGVEDLREQQPPSNAQLLAYLGAMANTPTDPDVVSAEFADMTPTRARALASTAKQLEAFFRCGPDMEAQGVYVRGRRALAALKALQ